MKRLTPEQNRDIVKAYIVSRISIKDIAKKYGRTRQGIWKLLKRNGVSKDRKTEPLTPQQESDIIEAYTVKMINMYDLGKKYNRTRQGIWKLLKRNGVNPTDYAWLKIVCLNCDRHFERRRCKVRNAGKLAHKKRDFCSVKCYYLYINKQQNGEYVESRHGQRIANRVLREYYLSKNISAPYGIVTHHIDRNCNNNDISNLMTFKNQSDHLKYHRGVDVKPVFDGSKL